MNIAQLFARIGLKADTPEAKKFNAALNDTVKVAKFAAAEVLGLGLATYKIMKDAIDASAGYKQFAAETGASTQELQQWQSVASQANVSTDALSQSVKSLAENREKIKLGQGNLSGFQFLGINPMQDPFKILEQLKEKTAGLPQAMKRNILSQMGISEQFIQILDMTNEQFKEMKANAFVIPEDAISTLNKTQGNINVLGNAIRWLEALIGAKLAPTVDKIIRGITNWIRLNKDGLVKGVGDAVKILNVFVGIVGTVFNFLDKLVVNTIGWDNALKLVVASILWFNRALIMSPIGMIIAGVLLLILVLDDLNEATKPNGKESFFGTMAKKNGEIGKIFGGILEAFKALKDVITASDFSGLSKLSDKWGPIGAGITTAAGALKVFVDLLKDLLKMDFSTLATDLAHDFQAIGIALFGSEADKKLLVEWAKPENAGKNFEDLKKVDPSLRTKAIQDYQNAANAQYGSKIEIINQSTGEIKTTIKRPGWESDYGNIAVQANRPGK